VHYKVRESILSTIKRKKGLLNLLALCSQLVITNYETNLVMDRFIAATFT